AKLHRAWADRPLQIIHKLPARFDESLPIEPHGYLLRGARVDLKENLGISFMFSQCAFELLDIRGRMAQRIELQRHGSCQPADRIRHRDDLAYDNARRLPPAIDFSPKEHDLLDAHAVRISLRDFRQGFSKKHRINLPL